MKRKKEIPLFKNIQLKEMRNWGILIYGIKGIGNNDYEYEIQIRLNLYFSVILYVEE
jgi:hypothetical protein